MSDNNNNNNNNNTDTGSVIPKELTAEERIDREQQLDELLNTPRGGPPSNEDVNITTITVFGTKTDPTKTAILYDLSKEEDREKFQREQGIPLLKIRENVYEPDYKEQQKASLTDSSKNAVTHKMKPTKSFKLNFVDKLDIVKIEGVNEHVVEIDESSIPQQSKLFLMLGETYFQKLAQMSQPTLGCYWVMLPVIPIPVYCSKLTAVYKLQPQRIALDGMDILRTHFLMLKHCKFERERQLKLAMVNQIIPMISNDMKNCVSFLWTLIVNHKLSIKHNGQVFYPFENPSDSGYNEARRSFLSGCKSYVSVIRSSQTQDNMLKLCGFFLRSTHDFHKSAENLCDLIPSESGKNLKGIEANPVSIVRDNEYSKHSLFQRLFDDMISTIGVNEDEVDDFQKIKELRNKVEPKCGELLQLFKNFLTDLLIINEYALFKLTGLSTVDGLTIDEFVTQHSTPVTQDLAIPEMQAIVIRKKLLSFIRKEIMNRIEIADIKIKEDIEKNLTKEISEEINIPIDLPEKKRRAIIDAIRWDIETPELTREDVIELVEWILFVSRFEKSKLNSCINLLRIIPVIY